MKGKRGIKNIPVIGYVLRFFGNWFKLPVHIKNLYETIEKQNAEITRLIDEVEKEGNHKQSLLQSVEELRSWNSDRMHEIKNIVNNLEEYGKTLGNHENLLEDSKIRIEKLERLDIDLKELNRLLSGNRTVWGEENKLHISNLASVDSCLFNTNSGSIYVGEYTFSGSNVSLLAGSHDFNLTGLLRRDCEIREGCDIRIGKGVWLASNSTILGPAEIGDNAVIAAGAVIVPGTVVPEGSIYAGIPAKEIGRINETNNHIAIKNALDRNGGVVFSSGWTEKRTKEKDEERIVGHFLVKNDGQLITKVNKINFCFSSDEETDFTIKHRNQEIKHISGAKEGSFGLVLDGDEEEKCITFHSKNNGLFVGVDTRIRG